MPHRSLVDRLFSDPASIRPFARRAFDLVHAHYVLPDPVRDQLRWAIDDLPDDPAHPQWALMCVFVIVALVHEDEVAAVFRASLPPARRGGGQWGALVEALRARVQTLLDSPYRAENGAQLVDAFLGACMHDHIVHSV